MAKKKKTNIGFRSFVGETPLFQARVLALEKVEEDDDDDYCIIRKIPMQINFLRQELSAL